MATSHGEYRGYLRNTIDMEAGQNRFQPVPTSESTYRSILFGTLVIMGLLQVASSIALLLHLTGYLQEVRLKLFVISTASSSSTSRARVRKVLFIKLFLCVFFFLLPQTRHSGGLPLVGFHSTVVSSHVWSAIKTKTRPSRCG